MPKKIYTIKLGNKEREHLENYVTHGKKSARSINRARILLMADEQKTDKEIAKAVGVCRTTVHNVRKKSHQGPVTHPHTKSSASQLNWVLEEKPRSGQPIKVDSRVQANVAMIACSAPPEGSAKWTLELIADKLVELKVVDSICRESVRKALKKTT